MQVQVKLFATLRQGRFKTEIWELPVGTQLKTVLDKLSLQPQEVAICMSTCLFDSFKKSPKRLGVEAPAFLLIHETAVS